MAKAVPDGVWFFEVDSPGMQKTIQDETGKKFPQTFAVRSSPGKGHFYFQQTAASILMGNRQGKDVNGKEAWSARVHDRYVVGPGSIHPRTLQPYMIVADVPLVPAPDGWSNGASKMTLVKTNASTHLQMDRQYLAAVTITSYSVSRALFATRGWTTTKSESF